MAISLGGFSGGGASAVTSVNTQTGAVVLSGDDLAADHTASNYTAANANIDGHLSGIDTKLGTLAAGLTYKGTFDASAGTPSLTNALQGDLYIIDTAGTLYGQTWAVGDHLLVNEDMGGSITNSKIDKVDNTDQVTSVNTQTGAVVLSGDDLAADHTAVNYTASNANIDGHLAGIDSALGASANPTLDGVTTNGNTTTNAINVGTVTTSGDLLADSADTRTIGAEDTRFITYYGDMNGAIRFKAKNDEGAQITKGQAVYIKGLAGDGTTPTVGLADANDPAKMPAFGLAFNTANNSAEIQIISVGNLGGLNTSGFSVGDTLFVDTTAGALTDTKPTGESSQLQNIGRVIRSDNGAGVIMVGGAGRSAATPNLDQDKIFLGNASNQAVSTALSTIGLSKFSNDSAFISDITNESLNDLSDVSFTAGAGIDNYVLTYDHATTSWGAEAAASAPVSSVNTLTGAVVLSANDLAADHTASNYTATNANIDGHLSGIDSKLASQLEAGDNISLLNNNSGFISDITGESLNDLSDVSFTAGAGIDNYVLKYDHATTSWGAEAESTAAAASETVAGVIEIATNAEATAGTATDKALVPSNISSLDLSAMDNTTSAFISDITSESLNDLSDVSYTAGAGIDNYVLTYDHATTSWGAVSAPTPFTVTNTTLNAYTASANEIINHYGVGSGAAVITMPSSAVSGDVVIIRKSSGQGTMITINDPGGSKIQDVNIFPYTGNVMVTYDGTNWVVPRTNYDFQRYTTTAYTLYGYWFGRYVVFADGDASNTFTVNIQVPATSLLEGARQLVLCRGARNLVITSPSSDIVDPTDGAATDTLVNSVTVPAHGGIVEIWVNGQGQYIISAPLANLSDVAFSGSYADLSGAPTTATETTEGIIEIATNAEATAGTATDKALVPSNISSLDLSAMDNTTSGFISDITSESLNDLSDVSFTAGAGIDNYVLTYDHATTSWGAEAASGGASAPSVTAQNTTATLSAPSAGVVEEVYTVNSASAVTLTLVSAATVGEGFKYQIKRLGAGAVTVDPASTEYIDHSGQTTFNIGSQYDSITLISDGANWLLI